MLIKNGIEMQYHVVCPSHDLLCGKIYLPEADSMEKDPCILNAGTEYIRYIALRVVSFPRVAPFQSR